MAAGQQKRRLHAASVMRFSMHDSSRKKKAKKLEASNAVLNMTSRVSLEWDNNQNKAVAKREQVGITWRNMALFLDVVPQLRSCLADVFSVPQEIFALESITDLLSYEVWESCLSEQDKKLLIQFLPRGVDVDHVLQSLLSGENLHFGNPIYKWGASLCAGNLHPDAVIHKEEQLRANKDAYVMKLEDYHTEVIKRLSKLKEKWTNCKYLKKDVAEEVVRNEIAKPFLPVVPEKVIAFSCSQTEQPEKNDICYGDTEYMSYFKVSKGQHQLVANFMHCDGIQPMSLKRVLGDIKHFNVQPYATFVEEERRRMHKYWSQLANKDVPAKFENFKEHRFLVDKWRKSVQHELAEMKEWMDKKDENASVKWCSQEQIDERDWEQESVLVLDVQEEGCIHPVHHFTHSPQLKSISSHRSCQVLEPSSPDRVKEEDILQATSNSHTHPPVGGYDAEEITSFDHPYEQKPSVDQEGCGDTVVKAAISLTLTKIGGCEVTNEDIVELEASPSTDGYHQERLPSFCSRKHLCAMGVDQGNQDKITSTDSAPVVWRFLGSMNTAGDVEANVKNSVSCSKETWQPGSTEHPYYPTSENQVYASHGMLSFQKLQSNEERKAQLINLEVGMCDQEDAEYAALHVDNRESRFSSCANQDHNLLVAPFHKEGVVLPSFVQEHLDELNKPERHFGLTNDGLTQSCQFPSLFQQQQEMLLDKQPREKDLYMHQILNLNMPSGGRFSGQDHFTSGNSQDWTSLQSPMSVGLVGQNWLHGDNCARAGWSAAESASRGQCFGDPSNIDGSLFGVLSECNRLLSRSPYVSMNSEPFFPSANFGGRGNPNGDGMNTSNSSQQR